MYYIRAHYFSMMTKITFSADEALIQLSRQRAMAENTTPNAVFRSWLVRYVAQNSAQNQYPALMKRFVHVRAGRAFKREELNERK